MIPCLMRGRRATRLVALALAGCLAACTGGSDPEPTADADAGPGLDADQGDAAGQDVEEDVEPEVEEDVEPEVEEDVEPEVEEDVEPDVEEDVEPGEAFTSPPIRGAAGGAASSAGFRVVFSLGEAPTPDAVTTLQIPASAASTEPTE